MYMYLMGVDLLEVTLWELIFWYLISWGLLNKTVDFPDQFEVIPFLRLFSLQTGLVGL